MKRIVKLNIFCAFCMLIAPLSVRAGKALPTSSKAANAKAAKAEQILKETFAIYHNCKTYQHEAELAITATTRAETRRTQKRVTRLMVEKPNKIFFQWVSFVLTSDGKYIQAYLVPLQQYIVKPAPAKLSAKDISNMIMIGGLSSIVNAIFSDKPYEAFMKDAKHLSYEGKVKIDGKTYWKIKYIKNSVSKQMLIDTSTHLVHKITVTPITPEAGRWNLTITYKKVKINAPIDKSEFKVAPPAGARKVDRFSFTRWFGYPMEGKVIPDVSLPDLRSGKDVAVKSLLGKKVTFITFWASWCPPCRMELPELQKLYAEYKGKGFQVIGINLDRKASIKQAIAFAKKHKLTFPILNDSAQKFAPPMKVSSIPTMLIVDANGKILEAHQGYNPRGEQEFSGIIEKMIAGGKVK